jgi:hypothetical protein
LAVGGNRPAAQAAVIAASGFNDALGVNSNTSPNSPFTLGATVKGAGVGEPGWGTNNWVVSLDGGAGGDSNALADSAVVHEGDGALHILDTSGEMWVYRYLAAGLTASTLIEQYVRLPTNGILISRPGMGGTGAKVAAQWKVEGGKLYAYDGDGSGGGAYEDTGFAVAANVWSKISVLIDPASKTFDLFFNDVRYAASDPLNYRGNPSSIQFLDYLAQTEAWVDDIQVSEVPEPSSMVQWLGMSGILGFFFLRRKGRAVAS